MFHNSAMNRQNIGDTAIHSKERSYVVTTNVVELACALVAVTLTFLRMSRRIAIDEGGLCKIARYRFHRLLCMYAMRSHT